jgi:hypothetical protein
VKRPKPLAASQCLPHRTTSNPEMMTLSSCECFVLFIGVLACAASVGCRPSGAARSLTVVASGDTSGWIVPCGCTSNQSGGLPRRAAYVEGLRREAEIILVDVGGAARATSPYQPVEKGGQAPPDNHFSQYSHSRFGASPPFSTGRYDLAKFEAILRGEMLMAVAAHNIGAAEALFGPGELRQLNAKLGVPLLSANVRDRTGRLVAEPVRVVSAAGRRVALVGVLAERYSTAELDVAPPRQAAMEALRSAAGKFDTAIVLAYLPEDELRQFADALPEADVVLGGPTGQPISPKQVGPTLLASATSKGKFLVRLDAPALASADRWSGSIVELNEQFADNAAQMENIDRFRADLARWDFTPRQTGLAESLPEGLPKGFAVAGTEACRKCHAEDFQLWRVSKHAVAWKSLTAKGTHVDPECQRCHTTGYGLPGGFVSALRSESRVQVGCESCHGPSEGHAAEPAVRTAYFAQAKNHCTSCHDRENSPKFAYDKYWEQIRHGQQPSKDNP